jgi:hypothetical protein
MRLVVVSIALGACMGGTETDVLVSTNVSCSSISAAIVSLTHPNEAPATGAQTYFATCTGGTFGTAVYHPDSTQTDITVVATVDGSDPASCFGTPGAGCIIARRRVPVAYQTNVPIELDQACAGLVCSPTTTCMNGTCVSF